MAFFYFDYEKNNILKIQKRDADYSEHELYLVEVTNKDKLRFHFKKRSIARYKRPPINRAGITKIPDILFGYVVQHHPEMIRFVP